MVQRSKMIRSRNEWKRKAVQRAEELREHRKALRRYQQKIAQLRAEVSALEQSAEAKKTNVILPPSELRST